MIEVFCVLLLLGGAGMVAARYAIRDLTGAEKGCTGCPGCEAAKSRRNGNRLTCSCAHGAIDNSRSKQSGNE